MNTMLVWPLDCPGKEVELVVETSGNAFFFDRSAFSQHVHNSIDRLIEELNDRYPVEYRYPVEIPITLYLTLREKFYKMESCALTKKEERIIDELITQLFNNHVLAGPLTEN